MHKQRPDSSASRTATIQILREDIGTGYPMLMDEERTQAYSSACNMKKYFPICHFDEWVDHMVKQIYKVAKVSITTEPLLGRYSMVFGLYKWCT